MAPSAVLSVQIEPLLYPFPCKGTPAPASLSRRLGMMSPWVQRTAWVSLAASRRMRPSEPVTGSPSKRSPVTMTVRSSAAASGATVCVDRVAGYSLSAGPLAMTRPWMPATWPDARLRAFRSDRGFGRSLFPLEDAGQHCRGESDEWSRWTSGCARHGRATVGPSCLESPAVR